MHGVVTPGGHDLLQARRHSARGFLKLPGERGVAGGFFADPLNAPFAPVGVFAQLLLAFLQVIGNANEHNLAP